MLQPFGCKSVTVLDKGWQRYLAEKIGKVVKKIYHTEPVQAGKPLWWVPFLKDLLNLQSDEKETCTKDVLL